MKKYLFTHIATLLCTGLCTGMLFAQDVTPDFLRQNGNWVCLKINSNSDNPELIRESNEDRVIVERVDGKYYIISGSDSLFLYGSSGFKIDLPKDSGIKLHNKEIRQYHTSINKSNMSIPRPFVLDRDKRVGVCVFNIADGCNNVREQITVLRDWPSASPAITLVFSCADNPSLLKKDSILTISCDSIPVQQDLVLSKIKIKKDQNARFIKLKTVTVDNRSCDLTFYKGASEKVEARDDAYSSKYFAEATVDRKIKSINSIKVDYSYLDDELSENTKILEHYIKIQDIADGGDSDLWKVLSGILLVVCMLLCSCFLLFYTRRYIIELSKETIVPVKAQNTEEVRAEQETISTNEVFDAPIKQNNNVERSIEAASNTVFGPIPEGMEYSEFFRKIKEEGRGELQKLQNDIRAIIGVPESGQDCVMLVRQHCNDLGLITGFIDTYLGIGKDVKGYEAIIKTTAERLSTLGDLDMVVKEVFGQPEAGESLSDLLKRSVRSLNKKLDDEQQCFQQKLNAQKKQIESTHSEAISALSGKLQSEIESRLVDIRFFCSSQLAVLDRMRRSYNVCSKYISSGSRFGGYTKYFGPSLMSFIESAESIYTNIEEDESATSLAEKMSPIIQKALNDHTSWLNALSRLEAYARTEVLRKHMLRDGIHLISLTDLYYTVQEFLFNNRYTLNILPELFVDPDSIDDYICDNMDIVISNLFDYEEEIRENAIVDIIKIGYSHKDEPVIKTIVAYYSKPKA